MKQIQMIVDAIKKIEFVVKIARAFLAGFDTFNNELKQSLGDEKQ